MKVAYQTPEVKVIQFDVEGKIMTDPIGNELGGDIFEHPWSEEASGNDTPVEGA